MNDLLLILGEDIKINTPFLNRSEERRVGKECSA